MKVFDIDTNKNEHCTILKMSWLVENNKKINEISSNILNNEQNDITTG